MKKITFILFALISGTAFAQNSASDAAQVYAEIVRPLEITASTPLNFGSIASDINAGKVRVSTEGVRTFSNTAMKIAATEVDVSAAVFTINAPEGFSYRISIPDAKLTNAASEFMNISFDHSNDGDTAIGTGGDQELKVGALLEVASGQATGKYTGTAEVTISYE